MMILKKLKQQISSNYQFPIISEHLGASRYGGRNMHSIEPVTPLRTFGNVRNNGLITNLLNWLCLLGACMVDAAGIHPLLFGDLPPQCAALNRTSISCRN